MKSDVLFLWEKTNPQEIPINKKVDTVITLPKTLLWSTKRKNLNKSGMMRLAKEKVYKQITIRNVNTTRKIYELMKEKQS